MASVHSRLLRGAPVTVTGLTERMFHCMFHGKIQLFQLHIELVRPELGVTVTVTACYMREGGRGDRLVNPKHYPTLFPLSLFTVTSVTSVTLPTNPLSQLGFPGYSF
jgi:hypothetical protein